MAKEWWEDAPLAREKPTEWWEDVPLAKAPEQKNKRKKASLLVRVNPLWVV